MNQIRMEVFLKYYKKHFEKQFGKIKIPVIPGIDNDKLIRNAPEIRMEHQTLTLAEIEVRRRERKARRLERKARRAKRPWYLRWY